MSNDEFRDGRAPRKREPAILVPPPVLLLAGALIAVHVGFSLLLDAEAQQQFLLWFAFIPLRILHPDMVTGGSLPLWWTLVTHAFLHANLEHLLVNTIWLVVFATPCARRYGGLPLLLIFLAASAVGAAAFALGEMGEVSLLIGASGGVAGLTGAATRFIFQPAVIRTDPDTGEPIVLGRRLAGLGEFVANPRARAFALIFLGLNLAIGLLPFLGQQAGLSVAWEAHVGGYLAGLLMVPLFERRPGRSGQ